MCTLKKGVFEISQNLQENTLCQSLFFNKVAGLRSAILWKKRRWYRCFPLNSVKFLRTPFLQNNSGRLLLKVSKTLEKCLWKSSCSCLFFKDFAKIESSYYIFEIQEQLLSRNNSFFLNKKSNAFGKKVEIFDLNKTTFSFLIEDEF